jgi:hypothetical protein
MDNLGQYLFCHDRLYHNWLWQYCANHRNRTHFDHHLRIDWVGEYSKWNIILNIFQHSIGIDCSHRIGRFIRQTLPFGLAIAGPNVGMLFQKVGKKG